MMKSLICLLAVLATYQISWACSCAPDPPVTEALSEAVVVFVGRCTSGTLINEEYENGSDLLGARYTFEVQEAYKGTSVAKTLVIYTGIGFGDCGFEFRLGMSYLIYAYQYRGLLRTGICTRSSIAGFFPDRIRDKIKNELQELKEKTINAQPSSPGRKPGPGALEKFHQTEVTKY